MERIIVIGAGILGASTAYHLSEKDVHVTLVDRKDKGQATDAAAGIVCPWLSQRRNKIWYRLAKGGAKFYPGLIEELERLGETETGYKRVGALSLHHDEKKLDKMIERALKRREDAPEMGDIKKLTAAETKEMFPLLGEELVSVHVSGAARVDGRALRDALIRAAEKNGIEFRNGEARLVKGDHTVSAVKVGEETLEADKVIVTAGVWAKELFAGAGVDFLVSPQKAQILHLGVMDGETGRWPVVIPPGSQYLLGFPGGKVVAGATHEDEAGFDSRVTAGGMNEVLHKAMETAPGIAGCEVLEARVGFRPFTPGFLPVFGAVPGLGGVYTANGLGASGLTSGPYLGSELAKLVMGEATELDPEDYNVVDAIG
ncbi:FAD-binding oxidoreductase [Rossellomorea aquimaris]|uniref:NAD(P)/FAD-dependent oxidoreductase n=1 Tax=Rossellomorea aquimaris TaxID=189382 RepID=UPI001CD325BB|nr:FAD-dependent oxidoreductase [Rossellomorea aquimaris]MCA1056080.1 FAD-binding oxidoreductase [Rossellomorea aquimaris]